MIEYAYKARNRRGKGVRGRIRAGSEADCLGKIEELGLSAVAVAPADSSAAPSRRRTHRGSVGMRDLLLFTRQLKAIFEAGISVLEGLRLVRDNVEHPVLRRVLDQAMEDVASGLTLSQALERHPGTFRPFFVSALQAGEASGSMAEILGELLQYMEDQDSLRKEILRAIRYPTLVVTALAGALVFLLTFVVPAFQPIFARMKDDLPTPTRILLAANAFLRGGWPYLLAGGAAAALAFHAWSRSKGGRPAWDGLKLRIPMVGDILRFHVIGQFSKILSLLNRSGGAIVANLEVAARVSTNSVVRDRVLRLRDAVIGGACLSEGMETAGLFPRMMVQLVRIGENSGRLDDFLEFLGKHYQEEVRQKSRGLVQWTEPLLTVCLAGIVLFLALAIFLPYWNMIKAFR